MCLLLNGMISPHSHYFTSPELTGEGSRSWEAASETCGRNKAGALYMTKDKLLNPSGSQPPKSFHQDKNLLSHRAIKRIRELADG